MPWFSGCCMMQQKRARASKYVHNRVFNKHRKEGKGMVSCFRGPEVGGIIDVAPFS